MNDSIMAARQFDGSSDVFDPTEGSELQLDDNIDIVLSNEIKRLALKEYSSLKLAADASYSREITRHASTGPAPVNISANSTSVQRKRASSLGPPKRIERLAARADCSKDDLLNQAESSLVRQISQTSKPPGQGGDKDKIKHKLHVPYYYRITRHNSQTGMGSKYQTSKISPSQKRKLATKECHSKATKKCNLAPKPSSPVNVDHFMPTNDVVVEGSTPQNHKVKRNPESLHKKKSTASVTSKSSRHSKSSKHSKSNRTTSKNQGCISVDECASKSSPKAPASVQTTNTFKAKSTHKKDEHSRAESTPGAKKKKGYNKNNDDAATRKTEASKRSVFSSAMDRVHKVLGGISPFKKTKRHRNTDETAPMDILQISMNEPTRQDIRAIMSNGSDESLTMGTPKRDPALIWHDTELDTPISCLSMPVLGQHDSYKIKPKSTSYKNKSSDGGEVFDMPWTNGVISGKYSGPIDGSLNPHGNGVLKIKGVWERGELVYPELCNAEAMSADNARSDSPPHPQTKSKASSSRSAHPPPPPPRLKNEASVHRKSSYSSIDEKDLVKSSADVPQTADARRKTSNDQNSVSSHLITGSTSAVRSDRSTKPKWAYHIGQVSRSPNDMIIHRSPFDAIDSASMIQNMQQAFIKRSNGLWTCAVLVERGLQPVNGRRWYPKWEITDEMKLEESMLFVINDDGSTKIINRRNWGKFVRRMRADVDDHNGESSSEAEFGSSLHFNTIHETETSSESEEVKATDTASFLLNERPEDKSNGETSAYTLSDVINEMMDNEEDANIVLDAVNAYKEKTKLAQHEEGESIDVTRNISTQEEVNDQGGDDDERHGGLKDEMMEEIKVSTSTADSTLTKSSLGGSSFSHSMLNYIDE